MIGKIEKLDNLGRGILYLNGKVTFIPKTVPLDTVEFQITKNKKNYNEGRLIRIVEESPRIISAPCPYFHECGGCDFQNLTYEDTIEYKKSKVQREFQRKGFATKPIFIENKSPYNYRNKVTLKILDGKVGYYKEDSHNLVSINKCLIASSSINAVIPLINKINIHNGEVVFRTNEVDEILIWIKTKEDINIDINLFKDILLVGIVINNKTYFGNSYIYETINDIKYKVSYDSFFQVNPYIASIMFDKVKENINTNDTVLDIYSGVGTLSLSAAKVAKKVVGVEIVSNAVDNAQENAKLNNTHNAEFILSDVTKDLKVNYDFDKIIVDPPRNGISKKVIDTILDILPKIVIYVSCNPDTLLRDLDILKEKYSIDKLYIFDMFSYTYHVENVCVLKLKDY